MQDATRAVIETASEQSAVGSKVRPVSRQLLLQQSIEASASCEQHTFTRARHPMVDNIASLAPGFCIFTDSCIHFMYIFVYYIICYTLYVTYDHLCILPFRSHAIAILVAKGGLRPSLSFIILNPS